VIGAFEEKIILKTYIYIGFNEKIARLKVFFHFNGGTLFLCVPGMGVISRVKVPIHEGRSSG
jgi:hypothetical protein